MAFKVFATCMVAMLFFAGVAQAQESLGVINALSDVCLDDAYSQDAICVFAGLMMMIAGTVDDLLSQGPLTVFAPVDSYFTPEDVTFMQKNETVGRMVAEYHITEGRHTAEELLSTGESTNLYSALGGFPLQVSPSDEGSLYINSGSVTLSSTEGPPRVLYSKEYDNLVVHVIDSVAEPYMTDKNLQSLVKVTSHRGHQNLKSNGQSLGPFNPGVQTGTAQWIVGYDYYIRSATQKLYFPYLGFFYNFFRGFSNNPALYCQNSMCKGTTSTAPEVSLDELAQDVESVSTP